MNRQFVLSNHTGDILEVDASKKQVKYFRDPFGRESSSIPEWQYSFHDFSIKNDLLASIRPHFSPKDWSDLQLIISEKPDSGI